MARKAFLIPVILACFASIGEAKPLLVAVELESLEDIRTWLEIDCQSYGYFENTAVAEVDDSRIAELRKYGLSVTVIDKTPWSDVYVIYQSQPALEGDRPGRVIWRRDGVALREIAADEVRSLSRVPIGYRVMRQRALPDRFWEQLLTKIVPLRSLDWDPRIQSLVDEVNTDSLTAYIQRLQDFVTREAFTESSYAASEWLLQKFTGWGYAAEFDSFYVDEYVPEPGYERNVIASLPGSQDASRFFIIGGHFDSTSDVPGDAPGADDNASGAAATLEAARIMSNHSFDHTIKFICWGAEELLFDNGSESYAEQAVEEGWDISGVVILDMIGYMNDALQDCEVWTKGALSDPIGSLFIDAAELYAPSLTCLEVEASGSDAHPFFYHGFPALLAIEHRPGDNPNYHSTTDLLNTLSPGLYTAITKAAVATMAVLGLCPEAVEDVVAYDIGDGNGVEVSWSASDEPDIEGYIIDWGTASEEYTDSMFVQGVAATIDTVVGLVTDSTYYFLVRALDSDGYTSWSATEITCTPRSIPVAPNAVIATPVPQGIRIDWNHNTELDITGYRVYRRTNEATSYDSLNAELLADTTYVDIPLSGANDYYYVVKAADVDGNASQFSAEAFGRPMTLDQGIIVVDETRNTSSLPDSLQDAFYRYILAGYRYAEIEYEVGGIEPLLSHLAPYSAVVWHADDNAELLAFESVGNLSAYLDAGGKVWFAGWKPTGNLQGSVSAYPFEFTTGDPMYEYFGVSSVDISSNSDDVLGAVGLEGYPTLEVDPDKVPVPSWGETMRYFEAMTPLPSTDGIYTIDVEDDESAFEGAICGVRYLGGDFQTVFFGFPLYYMDQEQARAVAQMVMADFDELAIEEELGDEVPVANFRLYPNLPNPFSEATSIRYDIPHATNVSLKVYNIAGQLVRTLVDGPHETGVYRLYWHGMDDAMNHVGSGVYFYRLRFDGGTQSRRLTLLH